MLDRLFLGATTDAVSDALRAAPAGPIAVIGAPALARALGERGTAALAIGAASRGLRRLRPPATPVYGREDAPPVAARALAALVGVGAGDRPDWADLLAAWSRAVRDGGMLVLVDRAAPTELARRALCGGLAEPQQRVAGRTVVTSGIVTHL